jgi:class 3 adenylate cyclase
LTELIKIAEEYGGTVEKNTGDGLMAYFEDGDGTPADCGYKRAVAAALTKMASSDYLIGPILRATPVPESKYANVDIGATANFSPSQTLAAKAG